MAKSFKVLQARMSPEARARSQAKAAAMIREMTLADLREALKLTQDQLAKKMRVNQAAVSKIERRTDMYVSTLRRMIEKMGGELEIRARLPHGEFRINQFWTARRSKAAATTG